MKKMLSVLLLFVSMVVNVLAQDVILQGDITTNTTLTSNNTYLLKGFVRVQSGATLTIEAGTKIYGENVSQGALIIKPGGKITAMGTELNPIVFTSQFTKPGSSRSPYYGDWGGIILLGNAKINVPGGTASIEGPGDSYGGNDDTDNSGTMQYVRIEYPGIAFSLNNEINGLTFGGVGSGTVIEHIQVSYSGDDSYEWFGGTVNCKNLVAYRGWDDEFDSDFGYSGKLQFLLGVRDPEIADQSQSNGFESDNDGSGSLNSPRTSPTWWNVTLIGPKANSSTTINSLYRRGMHLRRSSLNKISNALIMGWPRGIVIDGTNTVQAAIDGNMWVNNSIVSGWTSAAIDTANAGNLNFTPATWFTNSSGRTYADNSEVLLTDPFNLTNPNVTPLTGSPVLTGGATPPNDGFFDVTATFPGAIDNDPAKNWLANWVTYPQITTDVEDEGLGVVSEFKLEQNFPNPFNPSTVISFSIPEASNVKLSVYNILGQEVAVLVNEFVNAGRYSKSFNGKDLSSGLYIYTIEAGSVSISKKMTLLK
jgi:hypothetical protein